MTKIMLLHSDRARAALRCKPLLIARRLTVAERRFIPPVRGFSWSSFKSFLFRLSPLGTGGSLLGHNVTRAEVASKSGKIADSTKSTHIYFLLDRSGSMQTIADDVVGGFNSFVQEQQRESEESACLNMTMVQFDSRDPQEVLFSAHDIAQVPMMCPKTFQPRGATPLFDAIGGIISMAEERLLTNTLNEEIVIVTFSDGHENSSKEHSRKSVFARIDAKQKEGWTFVFLGANQDSYAQGGQLGYTMANTQNFAFDSQGTQRAWEAASKATRIRRRKMKVGEQYDNEDFFEGEKIAEEDYKSRSKTQNHSK